MKSIAFAHYKGGSGKTTSCINIAGFLASAGKRVLVVDLDPLANATSGLGIDKNSLTSSIAEVFQGRPIKEVIHETGIKNLHLAPAKIELSEIEPLLFGKEEKLGILNDSLKEIEKEYDFVLIDTPPSVGSLIANGVVAAETVFVCFDVGVFALEGLDNLNEFFNEIERKTKTRIVVSGAILNKAPKSFMDSIFSIFSPTPLKEIQADLEKRFSGKVYLVPFSNKIFVSHKKGVPLSEIAPSSSAALAFEKIAQEVIENG